MGCGGIAPHIPNLSGGKWSASLPLPGTEVSSCSL